MKYFICAVCFMVFFAACNTGPDGIASTDSPFKTVVPNTPFVNAEKYVGTLPCADCEGIDIALQLNRNKTYILNSVYKISDVDSSTRNVKDTGSWNLVNDTIFLTNTKIGTARYIKTDTALIQLDASGNRITGPQASMYILHKK